jgi:hypothetical protein
VLFHLFCILRLLAGDKHFGEIPLLLRKWRSSWRTNVFSALMMLKGAAWVYRAWTIQEAVLPRKCTVQYGHMIAPWSMLSDAATNFERHQSSCCRTEVLGNSDYYLCRFMEAGRPIREMRQARFDGDSQAEITLPSLLWRFHNRRATDDRDKVFGLLDLVTDWYGKEPIRANYKSEAPQMYRNLVLDMIHRTQSLTILEGDLKKNRHPDTPSWVPDWSDPETAVLFREEHDRARRTTLFDASKGTKPALELKGVDILATSAIVVDTIDRVGEIMWPSQGGSWKPLPDEGHQEALPANPIA